MTAPTDTDPPIEPASWLDHFPVPFFASVVVLAGLSNWIGHRPFQTMPMSPAWFIPAVGNVVAPVAGVSLGFVETSWLFFSAGLLFWVILLVLVMNRLIFHDLLPGKMTPTLAILIAPDRSPEGTNPIPNGWPATQKTQDRSKWKKSTPTQD